MGLNQITVSLVLAFVFAVAILGFATQFAVDNNAPISISNDPEMTLMKSQIETNGSSFNDASENTFSTMLNTTISPGSEVVPSTAPFSLTPFSLLSAVKTIAYTSYQKIFGSDSGFSLFFGTFVAVLVLLIAFFIYKALRGIPD